MINQFSFPIIFNFTILIFACTELRLKFGFFVFELFFSIFSFSSIFHLHLFEFSFNG